MKIESAVVAMKSNTEKKSYTKTFQSSVTVAATDKALKHLLGEAGKNGGADKSGNDSVDISEEAAELAKKRNQQLTGSVARTPEPVVNKEQKAARDYRLTLLEKIMSIILNKKFRVFDLDIETGGGSSVQNPVQSQNAQPATTKMYTISQETFEHYESEKVSFQTQAVVKTSDGNTINIDMSINMSRAFYAKYTASSISIAEAKLCDPLVINFDAPSTALSAGKIEFDLDCDGKSDQISALLNGSGFLALDRNNDGKINDGSELFGTKSGDGFKDLSAYDKDGNGWIDENDDIFDKLRIWVKDENGNEQLFSLGEKGIGAIYLGNVATEFSLKDGMTANGVVRSTGIFLRENGTAGTMQHVDFAL